MSWVSIGLLEPACRKWLKSRGFSDPYFPGKFSSHKSPPSARGVVDAVLFGDFAKQILSPIRWKGKHSKGFRIWVLGSAVKRVCVDVLGMPEKNIGVIPRDQLFPRKKRRAKFPKKSDPWTLVYAGRISHSKNFDLLLRVVSVLQDEFKENVHLVYFGKFDDYSWGRKPAYKKKIETLIRALPWTLAPIFRGNLSANQWPREKLQNPVLISLSRFELEDFGVSVSQACALGWPSVLSHWGGHQDIREPNSIRIPADGLQSFLRYGFPEETLRWEIIQEFQSYRVAYAISNRRGFPLVGCAPSEGLPRLLGAEDLHKINDAVGSHYGPGVRKFSEQLMFKSRAMVPSNSFYGEYCEKMGLIPDDKRRSVGIFLSPGVRSSARIRKILRFWAERLPLNKYRVEFLDYIDPSVASSFQKSASSYEILIFTEMKRGRLSVSDFIKDHRARPNRKVCIHVKKPVTGASDGLILRDDQLSTARSLTKWLAAVD